MTMNKQTMKRAVVFAIAGATVLGAVTPAWSAPVLSNTAALKTAAPSALTDVRYRGRYYRNDGAAVALGILGVVGAVAATSAYRHNYYSGPGYYGSYGYPGYYGQPYGGPYYGPANYGHHYIY
jgi:hypothetical protein